MIPYFREQVHPLCSSTRKQCHVRGQKTMSYPEQVTITRQTSAKLSVPLYWDTMCVCVCVVHACARAQSCLTYCDPMDCSMPGSWVHGILLPRIRSGLSLLSPGHLSDPGMEPVSLCLLHCRQILYP